MFNSIPYVNLSYSRPLPALIFKSSQISSHLSCPICYQILNNPKRLYCGHTFCYKCLEHIFQGGKIGGTRIVDTFTCPICREIIDRDRVGRDRLVEGIVQELLVLCPYMECGWDGMNKDVENHFRNQCLFRNEKKPQYKTQTVSISKDNQLAQNPYETGSLLARIYSKSKQLQQKSSFEQLKETLQKQKSQKLNKKQLMKQKRRQKTANELDARLNQIQQMFRQKTDQEKQIQQKLKQAEKQKQRKLMRQKNNIEIQRLIKIKEERKKFLQKQKQKQKADLQQKKRRQQKAAMQEKQQKLTIFQRLYQQKKQQRSQALKSLQPHTIIPSPKFGLLKYQPSILDLNKTLLSTNAVPAYQPYKILNSQLKTPLPLTKQSRTIIKPTVIISDQIEGSHDYMKRPGLYSATYQKHRLVRRPYNPNMSTEGNIPEKIQHRYFTSFDQFSNPDYLNSDRANRKGQYQHIQVNVKNTYVGTTNMKF